MTKISATIITYNEARNIGRCIDSLAGVADEIIVIDTFSTDETSEICKQKGAKVIQHEWLGYAETKNLANSHTLNEYVLSIDADEALSAELKAAILEVKKNLTGVYSFNRLTNYCGKWIHHSGWYPDKKIRLFPKSKVQWQGAFIHEEIILLENITETFLHADLYHYSYYSIQEHYQKIEKYAVLNAKQMQLNGESFSFYKPWLSAASKFLTTYIFRLGFLDGHSGFMIARISAYGSYLKYKRLKESLSPTLSK